MRRLGTSVPMNRDQQPADSGATSGTVATARLVDPVCGMKVAPDSPHQLEHEGTTYVFCSARCLTTFREDPARYRVGSRRAERSAGMTPAAETPPSAAYTCPMHPEVHELRPGSCPKCGMALERAAPSAPVVRNEWTCSMHPEIVRDAPGSCPICGMALERRTVSAETDDDNPELRDMTRRFWVAMAFTLPLVLLAMGDLLPGRPMSAWLSMRTRTFWEFALATPVCLWSAWPFYVRAIQSVVRRSLNMFTLIGLGVSVAYVYSVVAALAPGIFPASFREDGDVAVYFEAAGVIVTLILLGQVLELRARSQTSTAIKKLLGM